MKITQALAIVVESVRSESGTLGQPQDEPHVRNFLNDPDAASTTLFARVSGIRLRRFYGPAAPNATSLNQEMQNRMSAAGFPGLPAFNGISGNTVLLELANFVDAFGDSLGPQNISIPAGATVVVVPVGATVVVSPAQGTE